MVVLFYDIYIYIASPKGLPVKKKPPLQRGLLDSFSVLQKPRAFGGGYEGKEKLAAGHSPRAGNTAMFFKLYCGLL